MDRIDMSKMWGMGTMPPAGSGIRTRMLGDGGGLVGFECTPRNQMGFYRICGEIRTARPFHWPVQNPEGVPIKPMEPTKQVGYSKFRVSTPPGVGRRKSWETSLFSVNVLFDFPS
jgi:hypothetical protein